MKVFISSVITGFEEFREAAADAALTLDHDVIRAEDFGATPDSPQVACLDGVRQADVAVLLLGSRYGETQASGISATHEEYREARESRSVVAFVQQGVKAGAADVLKGRATNQLWRNALLVVSVRQRERFDFGHVAVVACENDRGLRKTVGQFQQQLSASSSLLRTVSCERIMDEADQLPALADWSAAFRRRYLDLSPVEGAR